MSMKKKKVAGMTPSALRLASSLFSLLRRGSPLGLLLLSAACNSTTPSPQTAMRGDFSRFDGVGNYTLLASLFIPSGAGVVTVQFEPFGEGPTSYLNFMHLDFMPEGDVRVDDGAVRFGRFPRDQVFALSVNVVITATTATAQITLFGTGASGSADVSVNPSLLAVARKFGAVRFWMGFQSQGSFFVDDILVTRRNS